VVPFLDVGATLDDGVREAILADVADLLVTHAYTNGPQVDEFEHAFADYVGARVCVGMASGLDALRLALLAARLPPGDEVIVPANTFAATFEAVSQAGGVPVPVDVSEDDYNLDPACFEALGDLAPAVRRLAGAGINDKQRAWHLALGS